MDKEEIFKELEQLFDAIFDSITAEIPRDDNAGEFVDLREGDGRAQRNGRTYRK